MQIQLSSLDQMRAFAKALAGHLRAGDLLILSGNLGAGKTTFTQSLGRALGVAGRITSPTFVIAREHPSLGDGPALVHVDAYRLSDAEELGDLDLDSELEESITVVEWGAGLAEQLSTDYLGLTITPMFDIAADADDGREGAADEAAADADDEADEDERRIVELHGHGSTWEDRLQRVSDSIRTVVAAVDASGFDGSHGSVDEEDSQ
ncbi:MAG: tRNA (adenosine(37)-N6)-threonylcarbamoyltransferase complex ATPase subunit type 1 TsaE [Brevibacterium sp.]|uniref:tRNA (adenosine(37)-N6)-threonylcarbamoyltransferase complex ATPase subunit type 1 TsaE n=1 Tax=Brevibacterium sp. TaxID=1701 RepID=UPI0026492766|nr:tRNA (adenosine(37)-N6)-threonylcarbamoyltransferase complex ATPase subunit type 1 TsaE [Brevibacterium sp.]MDN5832989.1 tRNA (adenosine(37)-N6)-threonylcarbamoyltransferase complex ATPase subunit type 1 TsaE [Brevibacterium sp.]MDN5876983.1 tRNA (adenosine(37)-N6)-threonylcarbamoyltransferase complex ATPase subunit type 1 TsaE [Brevibacterium sp.]MDN5910277.1 tRNA (adenosine(37)-N6)-threonylcarbamoyltransferase complex ATPase subunit type 1 TsaE [Brevibacterium sp.]MDN6122574.1 tRNA (adenos